MADTDTDIGTGSPDAGVYRRAGLTEPESDRLVRTTQMREQTQSPWEASPPGIALWLIWRAFYKGFQGVWILASLGLSAWFGWQIVDQSGGLQGLTASDPTLEDRLSAAFHAAAPDDLDSRDFWQDGLRQALRGDELRRSDIDLFLSLARAGPDIIGRDRLALELLAGEGGDAETVRAELLAGPSWRFEEALDVAYRRELQAARHAGIDPDVLIFAEPAIRSRYQRSLFNWSIAQTSADAFFRGETGGQLELTSLPGLVADDRRRARLYGGLRQFVIQVCALAQQRPELSGCGDAVVPRGRPDAVTRGLAAIEARMIRLNLPDSAARRGAQILLTAHMAGRLSPQMEAALEDWLSALLPEDDALQVFLDARRQPGQVFAAPVRAEGIFRHSVDRRADPSAVELSRLLERLARIGRTTSITHTVRVLSSVDTLDDVERLQRLSVTAGDRLLAAEQLLGEGMYDLLDGLPPKPEPDPRLFQGLIAGLLSAFMVLLLTLVRLARPPLVRDASRLSAVDAWISRLFLGRKD